MDLARVSPELQPALRRLPPMPFGSALGRMLVQAAIALLPAAKVAGVEIRVVRDVAAGLRVYAPARRLSAGALLWIHGGGFLIGRPILNDRLCCATALRLGIAVVSVGYRLAPRHPFPAALDDCLAGWAWLQQAAAGLGVDRHLVAIGGQSAGGGLAASLVQRVHDMDGPGAAAQWLFCPMLDDRTAARRELDAVAHFVWSNRRNELGWRSYLGQAPGAAALAPYAAAARRADLRGLPPAWIGVGDIDLFEEEDRAYARRLAEAGGQVTFVAVPGAPHGFEAWAPHAPVSQAFIAGAQSWLGETLAARGVAQARAPAS